MGKTYTHSSKGKTQDRAVVERRAAAQRGKSKNMLNMAQQFKLGEWIQSQVGNLIEHSVTFEEAARLSAQALGFPVTAANIMAVNEALGTKWHGRLTKVLDKETDDLAELCQYVAKLEQRQQRQAAVIRRLCDELGSPGLCDDL